MTKSTKIKRFISKPRVLIFLLIPLLAFMLHKEYYSLTNIVFNPQEKSVQVTIRLFTDDMEFALKNQFEKAIELGTDREIKEADHLLELYLNQRFTIAINANKTPFAFIGKEFEKDVMYVYLEIPNISDIQQIEVRNAILIDSFSEQENIVKINYLTTRRSMILTQQHEKELIKF